MLEQRLQHLSELSSANFYRELKAWKETVDIGLNNAIKLTKDCDGDDNNGTEGDVNSMLDPLEAMETAALMEDLDNTKFDIDSSSDNEDIPPTQRAIPTETENKSGHGDAAVEVEHVSPVTSTASTAIHPRADESSTTPAPVEPVPSRQVDVINVPNPKRRGRARSKTKQLRQTKLTAGTARLAVHEYPSNLTVKLDDFVYWARRTADIKLVADMLKKYPVQLEDPYLRSRAIQCAWEPMRSTAHMHAFVIPVDLAQSMAAAVKTARKELLRPGPLDEKLKQNGVVIDIVASIDPKLWKFSGTYVGSLTTFYAVKSTVRKWFEDRKWLEQDWRKVESDVKFFGAETATAGLSASAIRERHRFMANEVISKFASTHFSCEFVPLSGNCVVSFENIVGGLCTGWLNDSPIDFCLSHLACVTEQCYTLTSLTWSVGWPKVPKAPIAATKFIIHPVNLSDSHWAVIIVHLQYIDATDTLRVNVYMYEPLIDEGYRDAVETVWEGIKKLVKEGLSSFVARWCQATAPNTTLRVAPIEWIETPQQPDTNSCGVLVVAQAYSYVIGDLEWQRCNVSKEDVNVMRLRMLWTILSNSRQTGPDRAAAVKTKTIHGKLVEELK